MHKNFIAVAISAALTLSIPHAVAQHVPNTARANTETRESFHFIRLSDLPKALPSSGHSSDKSDSNQTNRADVSRSGYNPSIALISSGELSDAEVRSHAVKLLQSGVGILVTASKGSPRYEAQTFGIEAHGTTALYQRLADGTLDVSSSDAGPEVGMEHWESMVRHAVAAMDKSREKLAKREDFGTSITGPKMHFSTRTISPIGENGTVERFDVWIERDAIANRDMKNITVITDSSVHPFRNGVSDCGWPVDSKECAFRTSGEGKVLYAPSSYRAKTLITWPYGESPNLVKVDHFPTGTQKTDQKLTHNSTNTTRFDWGVNANLADNLFDPSSYLGKLSPKASYSLGGGMKTSREESIAMTLSDYSVSIKESNVNFPAFYERGMLLQTNFEFARALATAGYFNGSSGKVKADKMTPMMRFAPINMVSHWSVPGTYNGKLTISTTTDIGNFVWTAKSSSKSAPDYRYDDPTPDQKGKITPSPYFPGEYHPVASITIDLGAPYINRTPVVLIQTAMPGNLCLALAADNRTIETATCSEAPDARRIQWYLDGADRYVSREVNTQCLDIDNRASELVANPCNLSLSQKWEWRYDRLHSKVGDGQSRAHWTKSGTFVTFNPSYSDALPNNPIHPQLKPWTSYPGKPKVDDMVPGFSSRAVPIPDRYKSYREVRADERWRTIPLLFNAQPR